MWNDDISVLHGWFDKLIVRRLDEFVVLPQDILNCPASFHDVPSDSPRQPNIVIGHYEYFEIHEVSESFFI